MSIGDRLRRSATKDEKGIDELHDSLIEAWLRRHGMSRFFRFILTILIAFMASTVFVQSNSRQQCELGKLPLASYVKQLHTFSDLRKDTLADQRALGAPADEIRESKNLLSGYSAQIRLLEPALKTDCNDTYPLFPGF